jgi:hypothetical protein
MPETYGLPEPEPTRTERASTVVAQAVAGQGIVRRTVLWVYVLEGLALGPAFWPAAFIGIIAAVLLLATDKGLS